MAWSCDRAFLVLDFPVRNAKNTIAPNTSITEWETNLRRKEGREMRNTLYDIIPTAVQMADSLEEAIRIVEEEVGKGNCIYISKELRDKQVESQWRDKVNAIR